MLKVRDIHSYYGQSHILQGVTINVSPGSVTALLGRNGMGKSTTINTIMGLHPAGSGQIIFKGENITNQPAWKIARLGVGIVPQGRRIFPSLTVKENLLLAVKSKNSISYYSYNLDRILDMFPVLRFRLNQPSRYLSGGEQEMLCISRALLGNPDLILMDEPFEGLAPKIVSTLLIMLKMLRNQGLSILLVEQNVSAALEITDYIYVMEKGKIVLQGTSGNSDWHNEIKKCILGF